METPKLSKIKKRLAALEAEIHGKGAANMEDHSSMDVRNKGSLES